MSPVYAKASTGGLDWPPKHLRRRLRSCRLRGLGIPYPFEVSGFDGLEIRELGKSVFDQISRRAGGSGCGLNPPQTCSNSSSLSCRKPDISVTVFMISLLVCVVVQPGTSNRPFVSPAPRGVHDPELRIAEIEFFVMPITMTQL